MMEVPVAMVLSAVVIAVLLPLVPEPAGKILVLVVAVGLIAGLYYMIVIPGWQPGREPGSKIKRLIWFGVAVLVIVSSAGGYVWIK